MSKLIAAFLALMFTLLAVAAAASVTYWILEALAAPMWVYVLWVFSIAGILFSSVLSLAVRDD